MKLVRKIMLILLLFLVFSCVLQNDVGNNGSVNNKKVDYTEYHKLFDTNAVHEVEIRISQSEFDRMIQDMIDYDALYHEPWMDDAGVNHYKVDRYYHSDFVYKGPLGDVTIEDVGFRTKGNYWSRRLPYIEEYDYYNKTHFRVKFNEKFDLIEGTEEYKERDKRLFAATKGLIFRSPGNDSTNMRLLYAYDLYRRAGIIVPNVSKAKLYLNIEGNKVDFGLYTIVEPINKKFLKYHYGADGNDGNLYKCLWQHGGPADLSINSINQDRGIGVKDWETNYRPSYDLKTNEETADHSALVNFVNNINNLEGSSFINYIDNNFDVDQFLKCMAMEFLSGNPDGYMGNCQNYYLYFHNNGKIVFIPYDLDHTFAGGCWDGHLGKENEDDPANLHTGWTNIANADIKSGLRAKFKDTSRPLLDKILAVPKYEAKYKEYLSDFINPMNDLFDYNDFSSKYNNVYPLYSGYVDNDIFVGETMFIEDTQIGEGWGILGIEDYFNLKIQSVADQLN